MRQAQDIHLPPKGPLDIAISYSPERVSKAEGVCVVSIRKKDGGSWHYTPSQKTEGYVYYLCFLKTTPFFQAYCFLVK